MQTLPDREGNQNRTALRGKLVCTATDNLKIRLIGDYLRVNEQAAPFSLLRVEQNAYVAVYNTCITGNAAIIAGVSALAGLPGLSNICRSEEHTSELQSLMRISYAVFCLKKKNTYK